MTDTNETPEPESDTAAPAPKAHRTRKAAAHPAPEPAENSVSPVAEPAPAAYVAPEPTAVVGDGDTDEVLLSRLEYKAYSKKSLSVHHLQRRLSELGYHEAYADLDGWYGDLTHDSVAQFQIDNKIEPASGLMDGQTAVAIFKGDPNVTLKLDVPGHNG